MWHIPGRIDRSNGKVVFSRDETPEIDSVAEEDLLDDVAEQVLNTGGSVLVLPAEQMPATTGVAAVYRF